MPKLSQLPVDSSPTLTDSIATYDAETVSTKRTLLSSIRDLVFNNIPSTSSIVTGYQALSVAPNTITANGNHNYTLVFNATNLTTSLANGMKLKLSRSVTAPTQCAALNGTNQYFSKTTPAGMTFTNNFAVSAWVKLSSYALGTVASRMSSSGTNNGWSLDITATGQIQLYGLNASTQRSITSYQSIPLNKWVHIAAQLDMVNITNTATTNYIMIDGKDVAGSLSSAGGTPSTFVQAGNLDIGARNSAVAAGQFFPGELNQVAIYSAKVTQATIAGSMGQTLTGAETSLASGYTLSNSVADLSANANTLTAQGSAVATTVDSPYAGGANASSVNTAGTTEFAEIFNISFSTNTTVVVQVPDGYTLPTTGGVSAVSYSGQAAPLGWPGGTNLLSFVRVPASQVVTSNSVDIDLLGATATVYLPAGRSINIYGYGTFDCASSGTLHRFKIKEGSTLIQQASGQEQTASVRRNMNILTVFATISGLHTFKLTYSNNQVGVANSYSDNANDGPTLIIELI